MVCPRCIKVVKDELVHLGYTIEHIELGKVILSDKEVDIDTIDRKLTEHGFELLTSTDSQKVEAVKLKIINLINSGEVKERKIPLSEVLAATLAISYSTLSTLFSKTEGITIEKYFVLRRIDKAKELLVYGELNASQIANSLGFSNVGHFSSQFKQVTGLSPSQFRDSFGFKVQN